MSKESSKMTGNLISLWIEENPYIEVKLYIYARRDTNEIRLFNIEPLDQEKQDFLLVNELEITASFSLPTKEQIERYKEKCGKWNDEANVVLTNRVLLRKFLLRYHLQTLDGLVDPKTKNPIKVIKDDKGKISNETEETLGRLHPNLLDLLVLKFEQKAQLMF